MIVRPQPRPVVPPTMPALRPGANVRMGRNPLGVWMEGPSGGGDFRHPYLVTASASGARVGKGLILGNIAVEPRIGRVLIGGDENNPQPVLKLNPALVNERGESWVCVEVTPDADGKLDEKGETSTVEVAQRDFPFVTEGETGRAPLALLVYNEDRPRVFQIAMFHYRYQTSLGTGEGARRKHFFT